MDKVELRRYVIKERVVHKHSLSCVISRMKSRFNVEISERSVQRWAEKYAKSSWNFEDKSKSPKLAHDFLFI